MIGKKLKESRIDLGLSQAQIGKEIGASPQGIAYVEDKTRKTTLIEYILFLRKKGVNINKILDDVNKDIL